MPYPRAEPYRTTTVTTDDGARLHVEESGSPDGTPAIWLHGGPGGSLGSGWYRTHFDPTRYRLIGVDQRGTGRSTPNVLDAAHRLANQTTQRLVADLEQVRAALDVDTWVVAGISWGTTLALAYALEHPDRVRALALMAVTTTSRAEVDWITEGVGRLFPEDWDRFERASGRRPGERVVEAYARRLADGDPADRAAAAAEWDRWESVHVSLDDPSARGRGHKGREARLAFATLVTRYWANDAFLPGDQAVLARVRELAAVPAAFVHGRRDVSGPAVTPWLLHRAWPASTLTVVEDEGHGGPRESEALTAALDGFA
ncbi:alpha/beta fold hydrolase [Curtobacterium sp. MCBA15_001]|uniref:alpha/beta fold hydrolase n=1 Tax=Curtobacterium sp. MCBA15_001 TaxID=1898731 RepID=UPI0008DD9433|nr:alpha/beta fold hydrolase [Curtobacterium sp. MCBA15_001]OIH94335.1 prolyl aminopeptidase [Curtobacterium sp. MCBA15_001]